jgi:hypothetical protein
VKPEVRDHAALWLPLVRRLTESFPRWTIWKNADAAFAGFGDVDSAAPMEDWGSIVGEFRRWAGANGLGPVIECRHPPKTMFLLAVDRETSTLVELDVSGRKYFRGGTLFRAEDLEPLSLLDERGFRSLRPGAQGLILLLTNGMRWGGRPDPEGLRKRRIPELLAGDLPGALEAARRFGLPVGRVDRAIGSLVGGSWDRRSLLFVEGAAIAGAVADPGILLRRFRFRLATKKSCPVLRAVFYGDRKIPGGVDNWLREVGRTHPVYEHRGSGVAR